MPKRGFRFLVVAVLLVGLTTGVVVIQRKTTPPPSLASGCRCVDDGMCSSGENTIPNISCDTNKNGFGTACCGNAPAESAPPQNNGSTCSENINNSCGHIDQGFCTRCTNGQPEYFCVEGVGSGGGCIATAPQSSGGTSGANWQQCNPNPAGTPYGVCSGSSQYACGSDFRETKCVNNHWEATGNCCQTPGDIVPPTTTTDTTTTTTTTTQTASSTAQTALASGKCDINFGLCQAFDPKTGEMTGWVPATKAVFCDSSCALAARMNVIIGSGYQTITIDGKSHQAYDWSGDIQTSSLNDKNLDVAAIKKAADANQVTVDANGYANPNLTADQVADLQKRVDAFNSQQTAVQQAILADINSQNQVPSQNANFKYLSPENQTSVTANYQKAVQAQADSNARVNTCLTLLQNDNSCSAGIPGISSSEISAAQNQFNANKKATDLANRYQKGEDITETQLKNAGIIDADIKKLTEIRRQNIEIARQNQINTAALNLYNSQSSYESQGATFGLDAAAKLEAQKRSAQIQEFIACRSDKCTNLFSQLQTFLPQEVLTEINKVRVGNITFENTQYQAQAQAQAAYQAATALPKDIQFAVDAKYDELTKNALANKRTTTNDYGIETFDKSIQLSDEEKASLQKQALIDALSLSPQSVKLNPSTDEIQFQNYLAQKEQDYKNAPLYVEPPNNNNIEQLKQDAVKFAVQTCAAADNLSACTQSWTLDEWGAAQRIFEADSTLKNLPPGNQLYQDFLSKKVNPIELEQNIANIRSDWRNDIALKVNNIFQGTTATGTLLQKEALESGLDSYENVYKYMRGTWVAGAPIAATGVAIAGIGLLPIVAPTVAAVTGTGLLGGVLTTVGTGFGIYGTTQGIGSTYLACPDGAFVGTSEQKYACATTGANTIYMALSTGMGVATGAYASASKAAAALNLSKVGNSGSTLVADVNLALKSGTAAVNTPVWVERVGFVNSIIGMGVFGSQAAVECGKVLFSDPQADGMSCAINFGMAIGSAGHFSTSIASKVIPTSNINAEIALGRTNQVSGGISELADKLDGLNSCKPTDFNIGDCVSGLIDGFADGNSVSVKNNMLQAPTGLVSAQQRMNELATNLQTSSTDALDDSNRITMTKIVMDAIDEKRYIQTALETKIPNNPTAMQWLLSSYQTAYDVDSTNPANTYNLLHALYLVQQERVLLTPVRTLFPSQDLSALRQAQQELDQIAHNLNSDITTEYLPQANKVLGLLITAQKEKFTPEQAQRVETALTALTNNLQQQAVAHTEAAKQTGDPSFSDAAQKAEQATSALTQPSSPTPPNFLARLRGVGIPSSKLDVGDGNLVAISQAVRAEGKEVVGVRILDNQGINLLPNQDLTFEFTKADSDLVSRFSSAGGTRVEFTYIDGTTRVFGTPKAGQTFGFQEVAPKTNPLHVAGSYFQNLFPQNQATRTIAEKQSQINQVKNQIGVIYADAGVRGLLNEEGKIISQAGARENGVTYGKRLNDQIDSLIVLQTKLENEIVGLKQNKAPVPKTPTPPNFLARMRGAGLPPSKLDIGDGSLGTIVQAVRAEGKEITGVRILDNRGADLLPGDKLEGNDLFFKFNNVRGSRVEFTYADGSSRTFKTTVAGQAFDLTEQNPGIIASSKVYLTNLFPPKVAVQTTPERPHTGRTFTDTAISLQTEAGISFNIALSKIKNIFVRPATPQTKPAPATSAPAPAVTPETKQKIQISQIISDVHAQVQKELAPFKTRQEIIDYITHDLESMGVEMRNGTFRFATKGYDVVKDVSSMSENYLQINDKNIRPSVLAHEWEHARQVKALLEAGIPTGQVENRAYINQVEAAAYATGTKIATSSKSFDAIAAFTQPIAFAVAKVGLIGQLNAFSRVVTYPINAFLNNLTKPLFNIRGVPVSTLDILIPWGKFGEVGQMGLNPPSEYTQVEKKLDGIFDNTPSQTFVNTVLDMQKKYGADKTHSYLGRIKLTEIYSEMPLSNRELLNQRSSPPSLDAELIIFLGTLDFGIPNDDPDYTRIQALKILELADNPEIMATRTGLDVEVINQITTDSRQIAIDAFREDFKRAYDAEVLPEFDLSASVSHIIFLTSGEMKKIKMVNGSHGSANSTARLILIDAEFIKDLEDKIITAGKYIAVHEFGHLLANNKWLIKQQMTDLRLFKNLEEARTIVFEMEAMGARGYYWSNYHSPEYEAVRIIFVNKIIAKLHEVSPDRVTQLLNQIKLGDFSGVIEAFGGVEQFENFLRSPDIFGSQISITPETKVTHPDGKVDTLGVDGAMYISRGDTITTFDGKSFTLDQSVKVELSFGYSHTAADPNYYWTWNDDDGPIGIGTGMSMRINYLAVSPDYLPVLPTLVVTSPPKSSLPILMLPVVQNTLLDSIAGAISPWSPPLAHILATNPQFISQVNWYWNNRGLLVKQLTSKPDPLRDLFNEFQKNNPQGIKAGNIFQKSGSYYRATENSKGKLSLIRVLPLNIELPGYQSSIGTYVKKDNPSTIQLANNFNVSLWWNDDNTQLILKPAGSNQEYVLTDKPIFFTNGLKIVLGPNNTLQIDWYTNEIKLDSGQAIQITPEGNILFVNQAYVVGDKFRTPNFQINGNFYGRQETQIPIQINDYIITNRGKQVSLVLGQNGYYQLINNGSSAAKREQTTKFILSYTSRFATEVETRENFLKYVSLYLGLEVDTAEIKEKSADYKTYVGHLKNLLGLSNEPDLKYREYLWVSRNPRYDSAVDDAKVNFLLFHYLNDSFPEFANFIKDDFTRFPEHALDRLRFSQNSLRYLGQQEQGFTTLAEITYLKNLEKLIALYESYTTLSPEQFLSQVQQTLSDFDPQLQQKVFELLNAQQSYSPFDKNTYSDQLLNTYPYTPYMYNDTILSFVEGEISEFLSQRLFKQITDESGIDAFTQHKTNIQAFWNQAFVEVGLEKPSWFEPYLYDKKEDYDYLWQHATAENTLANAAGLFFLRQTLGQSQENFETLLNHEATHQTYLPQGNLRKDIGELFIHNEILTELLAQMITNQSFSIPNINSGFSSYQSGVNELINILKVVDQNFGNGYAFKQLLQGISDYGNNIVDHPLVHIAKAYSQIDGRSENEFYQRLLNFTNNILRNDLTNLPEDAKYVGQDNNETLQSLQNGDEGNIIPSSSKPAESGGGKDEEDINRVEHLDINGIDVTLVHSDHRSPTVDWKEIEQEISDSTSVFVEYFSQEVDKVHSNPIFGWLSRWVGAGTGIDSFTNNLENLASKHNKTIKIADPGNKLLFDVGYRSSLGVVPLLLSIAPSIPNHPFLSLVPPGISVLYSAASITDTLLGFTEFGKTMHTYEHFLPTIDDSRRLMAALGIMREIENSKPGDKITVIYPPAHIERIKWYLEHPNATSTKVKTWIYKSFLPGLDKEVRTYQNVDGSKWVKSSSDQIFPKTNWKWPGQKTPQQTIPERLPVNIGQWDDGIPIERIREVPIDPISKIHVELNDPNRVAEIPLSQIVSILELLPRPALNRIGRITVLERDISRLKNDEAYVKGEIKADELVGVSQVRLYVPKGVPIDTDDLLYTVAHELGHALFNSLTSEAKANALFLAVGDDPEYVALQQRMNEIFFAYEQYERREELFAHAIADFLTESRAFPQKFPKTYAVVRELLTGGQYYRGFDPTKITRELSYKELYPDRQFRPIALVSGKDQIVRAVEQRIESANRFYTEIVGVERVSLPSMAHFYLVDKNDYKKAVAIGNPHLNDTEIDEATQRMVSILDPRRRMVFINLDYLNVPAEYMAAHEYAHLLSFFNIETLPNGHFNIYTGVSSIEFDEKWNPVSDENRLLNEAIIELINLRAQRYGDGKEPAYQTYQLPVRTLSLLLDIVDPSGEFVKEALLHGNLEQLRNAINSHQALNAYMHSVGTYYTLESLAQIVEDDFKHLDRTREAHLLESLAKSFETFIKNNNIQSYQPRRITTFDAYVPTVSGLSQSLLEKLDLQYTDYTGTHWKLPWGTVNQTINTNMPSGVVSIENTEFKYLLNNDGTGIIIYIDSAKDLFVNLTPNISNTIHINGREYLVSISQGEKPETLILSYKPFSKKSAIAQTQTSIAFQLGIPIYINIIQGKNGTIFIDNIPIQYELTNVNKVILTNDSNSNIVILSPETPIATIIINNHNVKFHASYDQNGNITSLYYDNEINNPINKSSQP